MIRVALASHGIFPDTLGGMERHTFNLARHLHRAGVDVDVLVPAPDRGTSYPFPVHYLPWPGSPIWLWSNHGFSRNVADWIEEHQPDVAFGQGFNLWAYLRRRRVPAVFHPHGLEMYGQHQNFWERVRLIPFRRITRYHADRSDAVVSLGGRLTEILRSRVGVAEGRLVEIPNAVDLERFPAVTLRKEERSFLFVGRLGYNKGIDLLGGLMRRLRGVPMALTIIGDGPLRSMVERMILEDSRVRHIRVASESDLRAEYARNETLLFTSRFEGMPTVILEAMASSCAVVATRVGAVETMVGPANGILAEPYVQYLEQAVRIHLSGSSAERRRMGEESRAIVERKFGWERVTPLYLGLLERLKAGHHA